MKIRLTNEKGEEVSNRLIDNSERLCQLTVDLSEFFLTRNKSIHATIEIDGMKNIEKRWIILNHNDVCGLIAQIWNEWRFKDAKWEREVMK